MEKGIFQKNGLDIDLILNEKVNELYSEKKLDILCTGLTEPILFSSEGHATQIVYRFSYSIANDVIVANSNIKNIESDNDWRSIGCRRTDPVLSHFLS